MATEINKKDIHFLNKEEAIDMFERSVKSLLGISTDQFLKNLKDGIYDSDDATDVTDLIALLPMIQENCQNKVS